MGDHNRLGSFVQIKKGSRGVAFCRGGVVMDQRLSMPSAGSRFDFASF
jgi:hypothetical protein